MQTITEGTTEGITEGTSRNKSKNKWHNKWYFRLLKHIFVFWLISLWVFWETGNPYKVRVIFDKIAHPHTIDFVDDVVQYYFPIVITLSIHFNLVFLAAIRWFQKGLSTGQIRVGGKAGQD